MVYMMLGTGFEVTEAMVPLVMMRRVFRNLREEEHAAMLLRHHRQSSEEYSAENAPDMPETH